MILRPLHNEIILLKQVSENHEPAFRQLYEGYAPGVYAVALQHLKLPHLAEDIVQSVFLKLWENRTELTSIQHFASWFYTIVRNTIVSSLRKQGSHETYINYLKERMEIAMDSPELHLMKKEQVKLVQQAVDQLSPQQRTAFKLQREEGLSYEEIGQRMGIATNTVRVHLHKAMESLRNYILTHSPNGAMVACLLPLILLDPNFF
ncbi:RNA polymerase sigma factor [Pseudobacter ginsenosidimutans]|uniref:RNA polymerase sigma-70 factor (ECF subfamily) n=1 Tax=Pseudobacter ginsenosidimutans TaxID=661488 RepID=A0A4V2F1P8_9BACT|nr:RNA polymerase sigma-70 factor [Pseudobacter ginsenosidimutans]RZS74526.1 RNA polymerase sigma-70 factor (ECF subfamily) [Pseudobacter ginsenosidimutans]